MTESPDCYCELGYECLDCARRRIARRDLTDAGNKAEVNCQECIAKMHDHNYL